MTFSLPSEAAVAGFLIAVWCLAFAWVLGSTVFRKDPNE